MSVPSQLDMVVCVRPPHAGDAEPGDDRVLSALDLRAVEHALDTARRRRGAATVTAVSLGDAGAETALHECLALGVDRAIHVVVDRAGAVTDPLDVAAWLAPAVASVEPQLVLCGSRSAAGAHAAVPRALAHVLALPFVDCVVELDVDDGPQLTARAVQGLERGDRWAWECDLPLVCAAEHELCEPRYLAVRRLRRASVRAIDRWTSSSEAPSRAAVGGPLVVETRSAPRIRPKKTAAPAANMSAADRMRLLRGGRPRPVADDGDDQPRRIAGSAEQAAAEILQLLERRELI